MNRILSNALRVFSAFSLSKVLGAVTFLVLPKILGPAGYGVWVTLLLIVYYAPIFALGTVEALLREYPYYVGKGDRTSARGIEDAVFTSILAASCFLIVLSTATCLLVRIEMIGEYREEIYIIAISSAIYLISSFFFHRFAAHQIFNAYSIVECVRAIAMLAAVLSMAALWSIRGAVYGYLLTEVIVCTVSVIASVRLCGSVNLSADYKQMWRAVKIGLPITIVWWALTFQTSVDRIVASYFLGAAATGHYGLGLSIVSAILIIPQAVNRVLYPRINEGVGKQAGREEMAAVIIVPLRMLSVVLPFLVGLCVLIVPFVYETEFPRYMPGMESAVILLLGVIFIGVTGNGVNYLIAEDKQYYLLVLVVINILLNMALSISLVHVGLSITGIAISTVITTGMLTMLIWNKVLKTMGYDGNARIKNLSGMLYPIAILVMLMAGAYYFTPSIAYGTTIRNLVLFVLFYGASVYYMPCHEMRKEVLVSVRATVKGLIKKNRMHNT
jgi:O-antigen/teichoic acid export membrane protein